MRATVAALHPDLLCLEIDPRYQGTALVGLFPPETVVLENLAEELSIGSVCVDWRANPKDDRPFSPATEKLLDPLTKSILSKPKQFHETIYEYATSAAGQRLARQGHDIVLKRDGEAAAGFWILRNTKIVDNCLSEAHQRNARRIVLVFGYSHKYILEDYLRHRKGVRVRIVPIVRSSGDWRPPLSVMNSWKKRLASLQDLRCSHDTDPSIIEWIDSSKRIEELSMFIRWGESR